LPDVNVRMLYFAAVRDALGVDTEELELPAGVDTVAALSSHLERLHPGLSGKLVAVRFAINEEFAAASATLHAGDTVAVIPPVAGG